MTFEEKAFAKLNLCLDVGEKLPDGYHAVRGIMQSTDFCDDVRLTPGDGPWLVGSNLSYLPTGETNLAARAALLFRQETGLGPEGGSISLTKRIPVCGGYGGGSSDAAAVLRIMNRLSGSPLSWAEREELSIPLGADVPFCIRGGTALAAGKGEKLNPLPAFDGRALVLCRPDFSCSTPQLFKALDARKIRLRPDVGGMVRSIEEGDTAGAARRICSMPLCRQPKKVVRSKAEPSGISVPVGTLKRLSFAPEVMSTSSAPSRSVSRILSRISRIVALLMPSLRTRMPRARR